MKHFPVFLNLQDKPVLVSGTGETSLAKLRLLLKTEARISVFGVRPDTQILRWEQQGKLTVVRRSITTEDVQHACLIYAANDDIKEDTRLAHMARESGVLINVVDNLENSDFITPAIVDRDPVTVAIGTEGAAPVLARKIKAELEQMLPASLGQLARIGQVFRPMVEGLPDAARRRALWSDIYAGRGIQALREGGKEKVKRLLHDLLKQYLHQQPRPGNVALIGAGPGDPELLTLRARNYLHEADVVIHDQLVPAAILELARREAIIIETGKKGFAQSWKQEDINQLMVEYAAQGCRVARLKSGDATIFGRLDEEIDALQSKGVAWVIIPGVTAASVAAANIGVSLTRRNRNSALTILRGHDIKGFAEHDWRELAKPGATVAIYMGKRAVKFLRGRLMMYGANGQTPVTAVENISRPEQKILSTNLLDLPAAFEREDMDGPVIFLLGLRPRDASNMLQIDDALMVGSG